LSDVAASSNCRSSRARGVTFALRFGGVGTSTSIALTAAATVVALLLPAVRDPCGELTLSGVMSSAGATSISPARVKPPESTAPTRPPRS